MKHIALYIDNSVDKRLLFDGFENQDYLELFHLENYKKTALYSAIAIEKILDEEIRHDRILIRAVNDVSLRNMSSGQQRKALLAHLIDQKPDLMILDDVYSHVDSASQTDILVSLNAISDAVCFVQILTRKRDLLPFINEVYMLNVDLSVAKVHRQADFLSLETEFQTKISVLPDGYSSHNFEFNTVVEMKSVSVKYEDRQILNDVNWLIRPGEFWQLAGPNGSGKSTLISMITGDNPKAYGQDMKLFGFQKGTGESIWDIKQHIGYFTPSMMPGFERNDKVENMIISGFNDSIGLYTQASDIQNKIAAQWITLLGSSFENKYFRHLSLGQQRMVMVARALVKHPPLLILDEPTIELDEQNSQLFIDMVNSIAAEKELAIIYVSHREEENLKPSHIFELTPTQSGYTGVIRK